MAQIDSQAPTECSPYDQAINHQRPELEEQEKELAKPGFTPEIY